MKLNLTLNYGINLYNVPSAIPSNTAHGVHTFSIIKNLARSNIDVSLVYPLRDKDATKALLYFLEIYGFDENNILKFYQQNISFLLEKLNIFQNLCICLVTSYGLTLYLGLTTKKV